MNDEYLIYGETLTAIADSIRSVSSVSTTWTPDEMAAYILANLVKPTSRQAAKTYTPSTSNQTIAAGTFLTGAATIKGDADLVVGNIKKGVEIFGKTGTLSGIWGDPSTFYGFTAVKAGSFTKAGVTGSGGWTYTHTVTHGLGVIPRLILYYTPTIDNTAASPSNKNITAGIVFSTSGVSSFGSTVSSGQFGFSQRLLPGIGSTGAYTSNAKNSATPDPFKTASSFGSDSAYGGYIVEITQTQFSIKARDADYNGGIDFSIGAPYYWIAMA